MVDTKIIKRLRTEAGQSQEELAKSIGVTVPAVSGWENGSWNPSLDNLRALSRHFNVSVDELLGEDGRAA